jgi:hypothetical protein
MSRQFSVVIREHAKTTATRIDAAGVIVLSEVQKGVFQMSLRGVDMADVVVACATLMKYATEMHPGFPDALERAVQHMDSLPEIAELREAP